MLDFIWANKAWLFEGAGVAMVVGFVTLLYNRFGRKYQGSPSHITVVQVVEADKRTEVASRAADSAVDITKVTRISPLSFQEILDVMADAPPLQEDTIGERFKGITVQWKTQIYDMKKTTDGKVQLTLHFGAGKPGLIFCDVSLSQYQELAYLKKETPVTVFGVVKSTRTGSVSLENAQLFFRSESM